MRLFFTTAVLVIVTGCASFHADNARSSRIDDKEIKADHFEGSPQEELAHMLRKEAGVIVSERNGRFSVVIRGLSNSINNPSPPLYVINGISVGHDFFTAAESTAGTKIMSIKVLKDQQASFYGVRGAGGVVEIKTN